MRNSRLKLGSTLPMTLVFFTIVGVVTVAAVGVTTTRDSMAFRGAHKAQATNLAESGVNLIYDRICRDVVQNKMSSKALPAAILSTSFFGKSADQGSYTAKVTAVNTDRIAPAPGFAGTSVQYTYSIEVEGRGKAPIGTESVVRASFKIRRVLSADDGYTASTTYNEFPAAVNANGKVSMVTDKGIRTYDVNAQDKEASILGNRGITWETYSLSKNSVTAPDLIDVDGHLLVASKPTPDYVNLTTGAGGLGNPNGTKNYKSAGPWQKKASPYAVSANEVTQTMLLTNKTTTVVPGNATVKNFGIDKKSGLTTINAPTKIGGSLTIGPSDTVILNPTSQNPAENVVYVSADVLNQGSILNLGCTLVIVGKYTDTPTSVYDLRQQGSIYDEMIDVYSNSKMVSLAKSPDAINISSGVNARYGTVYAAKGSINVTGTLEMNGILTAGGDPTVEECESPNNPEIEYGSLGNVNIVPANGGLFTIHYIREATSITTPGGSGDTSLYLEPVRADSLSNWRQIK